MWAEVGLAIGLGTASGTLLTLMDRIDEHPIIERWRTPLAYLAGVGAALAMAASVECLPVTYPLLFGMLVEWIVKNKIDFPSHVFSLFCLALFFGYRAEMGVFYAPWITGFLLLRWVSGSVLKRQLAGRPGLAGWWYASYAEKLACNALLAALLGSVALLVYALGFTVACLYIKRRLPGR